MSIEEKNAALVFAQSRWAQWDVFNSGVTLLLSLDEVKWRDSVNDLLSRVEAKIDIIIGSLNALTLSVEKLPEKTATAMHKSIVKGAADALIAQALPGKLTDAESKHVAELIVPLEVSFRALMANHLTEGYDGFGAVAYGVLAAMAAAEAAPAHVSVNTINRGFVVPAFAYLQSAVQTDPARRATLPGLQRAAQARYDAAYDELKLWIGEDNSGRYWLVGGDVHDYHHTTDLQDQLWIGKKFGDPKLPDAQRVFNRTEFGIIPKANAKNQGLQFYPGYPERGDMNGFEDASIIAFNATFNAVDARFKAARQDLKDAMDAAADAVATLPSLQKWQRDKKVKT